MASLICRIAARRPTLPLSSRGVGIVCGKSLGLRAFATAGAAQGGSVAAAGTAATSKVQGARPNSHRISARDYLNMGQRYTQDNDEAFLFQQHEQERPSPFLSGKYAALNHATEHMLGPEITVRKEMLLREHERETGQVQDEDKKKEPRWEDFGPEVDERGASQGVGHRKRSVARAEVRPGTGQYVVNGLPHNQYFHRYDHRISLFEPFEATASEMEFDVVGSVQGGGHTGQADALRLAIAVALARQDPPKYGPLLAREGLLIQDTRQVEPKKPGRTKARRLQTWKKR